MPHLDIEIYPAYNAYKYREDLTWSSYTTLSELKQQLIRERADSVNKWINESECDTIRKKRIEVAKNAYLKEEDITFYCPMGFNNIII